MRYLQSPGVHHRASAPFSLLQFADKQRRRTPPFAPPYQRPSLALFNAHCEVCIHSADLPRAHIRGEVEGAEYLAFSARQHHGIRAAGVWQLQTSAGLIEATNVVLAIGNEHTLALPPWATQRQHIFTPSFDHDALSSAATIAVVGGGISAAQFALSQRRHNRVTLHLRHPLRVHQFDSDPGWLGPKYMNEFAATTDLETRRQMIRRARHRGSVPPDVDRALRRAQQRGELTVCQRDTVNFDPTAYDAVVCATGSTGARPGGAWINRLIATQQLPVAACGAPICDASLQWSEGLFVMGALAELQLGPTSRNIAGARNAAARISTYAKRAVAASQYALSVVAS